MASFAIIENEQVVNVIAADQNFIDEHYPDAICIDEMERPPSLGWSYKGKKFIEPPQIIKDDEAI